MATTQRTVHTKIVATVGPASEAEAILDQLFEAGVDVFRLNFAHGDWAWHSEVVRRIRALSVKRDQPVAILQDLGGPKLRLGELVGGQVQCVPGAIFRLVGAASGAANELTCTYAALPNDLRLGDVVVFADGNIAMKVVAKEDQAAVLEVTQGGLLASRQGVAAPRALLQLEALTPKDLKDLDWTARHEVDFVGLSFVRRPGDVERLRGELRQRGSRAQIIAKIERAEALNCLDDIIRLADGVMVARGDLGIEIDVARVPLEQKRIIRRCLALGAPVITATQMLESMRTSNRPTRAEASDVANAILDGADAVMLSGETASGAYPVLAVETMNRICRETEAALPAHQTLALGEAADSHLPAVLRATVNAASLLAAQVGAKLIVVATKTGRSALALAKHRNRTPTVGLSDVPGTVRALALYWGIMPVAFAQPENPIDYLEHVAAWAKGRGLVAAGDRMVFLVGTSWQGAGHNTVIVHAVQ
jgi:pyruvate kinase